MIYQGTANCEVENKNTVSSNTNLFDQEVNENKSTGTKNQLNTTTIGKNLNTTSNNLNQATEIPITIESSATSHAAKMMGLSLPGSEFQDLSGAQQTVAVEELLHSLCSDEFVTQLSNINNNNNNSNEFYTNKEELNGLHDMMTIDKTTLGNEQLQLADHLPTDDGQFIDEMPGEEEIFNNQPRMPYSEEQLTLTQPDYEQLEQLINGNGDIHEFSDDSHNSYSNLAPRSPLPTERDCISPSKIHNFTYDEQFCNIQNNEAPFLININEDNQYEYPSLISGSDEEDILKQILYQNQSLSSHHAQSSTNTLKRAATSSSTIDDCKVKKLKLHIPTTAEVIEGTNIGVASLNTARILDELAQWEDDGNYPYSFPASPVSRTDHSLSPAISDLNTDIIVSIEPKYENPPSIASSFICDDYTNATLSPSNSSSGYTYSFDCNSPSASSTSTSRKPRGRPPKQHSDLPDPEVLRRMTDSERKQYENRCKNNEASRQSRQKNKEKLKKMQEDEESLQMKKDILEQKRNRLDRTHEKLKNVLREFLAVGSNQK